MKCIAFSFAVGLAIASSATAQIVRGRISEAESNRHLSAATVTLVDDKGKVASTASTDTAGVFQLHAQHPGSYTLRFDLIGYTPVISERIDLHVRETVQLSVQLSTQPVSVTPLVVTARQRSSGNLEDFERRRVRQGSGYFVTQDEIDRRNAPNASSLVMRVPGVRLKTRARGNQDILLQGTLDYCQASVFVDGRRVQNDSVTTSVDDLLIPAWIGGVEVYPRAASAPVEYRTDNNPTHPNSDTDCGIVLFWTRDPEARSGWSWKKIAAAAGFVVLVGAVAAH